MSAKLNELAEIMNKIHGSLQASIKELKDFEKQLRGMKLLTGATARSEGLTPNFELAFFPTTNQLEFREYTEEAEPISLAQIEPRHVPIIMELTEKLLDSLIRYHKPYGDKVEPQSIALRRADPDSPSEESSDLRTG